MEMKVIFFVLIVHAVVGKSLLKGSQWPYPQNEGSDSSEENQQTQHETRCDLYYRCVYGVKVIKVCPEGQLFNPQISNCDYRYNVECGNRKINKNYKIPESNYDYSETEESTTDDFDSQEDSKTSFKCPEKEDPYEPNPLLPHEESCNHFYKCIDGKKYLMKCSGMLQFNSKFLACDWPNNVRCRNKWKISTSTVESTIEEGSGSGGEENTTFLEGSGFEETSFSKNSKETDW